MAEPAMTSATASSPPDNTALRVALWRALHVQIDAPPHVLEDEIGLQLAAPEPGWQQRGDMHPQGTSRYRAGIVVRARFVEDLLRAELQNGVNQYVLLGAGLDTFAEREPDLASSFSIYEIDDPATQAWKRDRLGALGYAMPEWLHFVPVDFEKDSFWNKLLDAGFRADRPAVVSSTGVSMYLTKEANAATLRQLATSLAPGSTVVMTFLRPIDLADSDERPGIRMAEQGARAAGTPWLSFFAPDEIVTMARDAGFNDARHVSAEMLNERYFAGRPDGLKTSSGEEMLVARVA
jgi:methyltransferase (TIGR00027 family)